MALATLPLLRIHSVLAQQFGSRPIKIIVPASAGTAIDATARYFAEPLSQRLGTAVVIENRPGAGGLLGYTAAAKSPPDGHTLILTGIPLYLLPLFSESAEPPFDPLTDFSAVARVARVPLAIVVPPKSKYRTMSDLIAAMKRDPGQVTYSSQGPGSSAHLCVVVLNDMTRTKGLHVSYKESSTAVTDVVAGRVAYTCQSSTAVVPLVKGGKLRALAVTGAKRWESLPDIPTVAEAGVPGFEVSSQLDFMAPERTPAAMLQVLSDEITRIAQTSHFKEWCANQAIAADPVGSKEVAFDMPREVERWSRIARLARAS